MMVVVSYYFGIYGLFKRVISVVYVKFAFVVVFFFFCNNIFGAYMYGL